MMLIFIYMMEYYVNDINIHVFIDVDDVNDVNDIYHILMDNDIHDVNGINVE